VAGAFFFCSIISPNAHRSCSHTTHLSGLGSGASAFGEQINGLGSTLSANRSMRCFRRAPIHAHQLPLSLPLPTIMNASAYNLAHALGLLPWQDEGIVNFNELSASSLVRDARNTPPTCGKWRMDTSAI